jgi:hypothetical protein
MSTYMDRSSDPSATICPLHKLYLSTALCMTLCIDDGFVCKLVMDNLKPVAFNEIMFVILSVVDHNI